MKSPSFFNLEKSGLQVKIEKLSNQAFYNLVNSDFAAVHEDYGFLMYLDYNFYEKYDFTLPKIYTALYTLYGKHNGYDDYKCSFSYRFRLKVINGGNVYTYLLSLMDIKGNPPYFTFYRPLGKDELDKKGYYQQPVETEFSKEAMKEFMAYFVGYLLGTFNSVKDSFKKPFFRTVPYCYVIYGFKEGKFFEDSYYLEDEADDKEDEDDEDDDYGYSAFIDAVNAYKSNPKMKGNMSARQD